MQLLKITNTFGKNDGEGETYILEIRNQEELDLCIDENTWDDKPYDKLVYGTEGTTYADKIGGDWDEPDGVTFKLVNISTQVQEYENQISLLEASINRLKELEKEN